MNTAQTGVLGEELAAKNYQHKGFLLLARNFKARTGEIDLVALKQNVLVFVEVKTRGAGAIARPKEWVTLQKQHRIIAAAGAFLQQNPQYADCLMRFDVVEVQLNRQQKATLNQIENAFTL
ncbi:YraN family protein [Ruminococcaceae bacterium OttesenSCG-928-A16]|nr:YraN family protein [Ruminococcaceae bacterium OttesenSCG-928-A16]